MEESSKGRDNETESRCLRYIEQSMRALQEARDGVLSIYAYILEFFFTFIIYLALPRQKQCIFMFNFRIVFIST